MNYNSFHKKNKEIQKKIISENDYTYQSLINLTKKYFVKKGLVLDIGCGVGTICLYLASKEHDVCGIDISRRAIELANKSKESLNLKNIDFNTVPVEEFNDAYYYDYIICSEVLEHIKKPLELIELIRKKLKRHGVCILSVPSTNAPLYRLGLLRKFDEEVGHLRRYNEIELLKMLEIYNFKILEVYLTEGILRNLLYTMKGFGFLIRFVRYPLTIVINYIDQLLVKIFGESNIYIVLTKI